jgi:tRNA-dihydrouridine synthase B
MTMPARIPLPATAWLAPMSGATDAAFRRQVARFGHCAVVSEMVAGEALVEARADMVRRTCRHDGDGLWIVQLAARRPDDMRAGAALMAAAGVDVIDINMGCPARKVTGGQSGSALMREPELAREIIAAAIDGTGGRPVTLKMRLGWDHDSLNAPALARDAEDLGVSWITVHGRTRCMFYTGEADWRAIGETVGAVSIPVIANGDIETLGDAREALAQSGAAGVMIGRGAMGRPWQVAQIGAALEGRSFTPPDLAQQAELLIAQVADSVALYGERLGVRTVRKHVAATIDHLESDMNDAQRRALRGQLCRIESEQELIAALAQVFAGLRRAVAA